jgi:hypothetical protein
MVMKFLPFFGFIVGREIDTERQNACIIKAEIKAWGDNTAYPS